MAKLFGYLSTLFWASLSMVLGLLLFTNGFFLRKDARIGRSNCTYSSTNSLSDEDPLTDATKCFDDTAADATFHKNKIPIISRTLKKYPRHSRLLKFMADPPTTTMQRLKAITTGTLPTFIDSHDNFAADSIMEDNLIDQIGNQIVFMGDDTWTKLYPNKFLREYAAPSFDVSDLDTVDLEVRRRIFDEIKQPDWRLLVAHTLGVDHCGHKHGMHHPEMSRKLNETNFLIKNIIETIKESSAIPTVLFVVGDHGMTESGDHGGESLDEVEAAMFVYSNSPLIDPSEFNVKKKIAVNQIDIVPTISIILGIPIPFSNIGKFILEAIP